MTEIRRKPTTGIRCSTLFDEWHGIFYMPSRTDTAGHINAFDYPVTQTRLDIPRPLITQSWATRVGGRGQTAPTRGRYEPLTCQSPVGHTDHQTTMTATSRRINYTPGPQRRDILPIGESSVTTATPRVGHPQRAPRTPLRDSYSLPWVLGRDK